MRVGIVGLGLIGGSLGLDLRSRGFEVLGVSRQERTCRVAVERRVVDEASLQLNLLETAELIFLCTPMAAIAPTLQQLIPYLSAEAIVTDVGSVKTTIVSPCTRLWQRFVGGHPMAGTAEQGIEAAQQDLFVGAPYVITPLENTPEDAVLQVEAIARSLGSKVYTCTPEAHDRAVAWISHLPAMVSTNLIDACSSEPDVAIRILAQQLASSGFRDTSRVGGGNPELGVMMAQYNRDALLRSLSYYRQHLDKLTELIEKEDWQSLQQILRSTQRERTKFLQ